MVVVVPIKEGLYSFKRLVKKSVGKTVTHHNIEDDNVNIQRVKNSEPQVISKFNIGGETSLRIAPHIQKKTRRHKGDIKNQIDPLCALKENLKAFIQE